MCQKEINLKSKITKLDRLDDEVLQIKENHALITTKDINLKNHDQSESSLTKIGKADVSSLSSSSYSS